MNNPSFELDLYLIRHGESGMNVQRAPGTAWEPDPPLTERGIRQMQALGRRLAAAGVRFDRVYSSSLRRAVASAEALLDILGKPGPALERVPALDELRVALRDGRPFDQGLSDEERKEFAAAGQWWVYGPEAGDRVESERLLQRRVMGWIEDRLLNGLGSASPDARTVALIMHGGSIRTALQSILGFDGTYIRRFQIDNASISRLKFNRSGWFPISINDAWHAGQL